MLKTSTKLIPPFEGDDCGMPQAWSYQKVPRSEWQDIETAPRDGTRILVFCPSGCQFDGDEYAVAYYCTDARVWYSRPAEIELDNPVKWMPIDDKVKDATLNGVTFYLYGKEDKEDAISDKKNSK